MIEQFPTGILARKAIAAGRWRKPTAGLAPGYVQANLVVLPEDVSQEFAAFCAANPKPCPLLHQLAAGDPHPAEKWAVDSDIRVDIPRYRLYRDGQFVCEYNDILQLWQQDLVGFLLGCSFTFEEALLEAGIPVRHIECGCNVPMYKTNLLCNPVGRFSGPMVVSMRPIPEHLVEEAIFVTTPFSAVHGAPIHIGHPAEIGIADIGQPDYGDPVPINSNEIPVFWACGVTPQAVAQAAKLPLMITHAPGYMFITDQLNKDLIEGHNA